MGFISEAKILKFLGEKEQNEYVVQNYYMSVREEVGVTYLKEIMINQHFYHRKGFVTVKNVIH